jgi:hypothetical protein
MFNDSDARVAAGGRLLDQRCPGWAARIDGGTLDLADAGYCVLGQLYGDFYAGAEALNLSPARCMDLGFASCVSLGEGFFPATRRRIEYAALTRAWLRELAARRRRAQRLAA